MKIRLYIKNKILSLLKDIYEPLGMWTQNPKETEYDLGVIYDGEWDPLMQADTNYTGWSMIFNRCNMYLVNLYRNRGIEQIDIFDEKFSYKNQFIFKSTDSHEEIFLNIDKIFKIIEYKKEEIFLIGNPFCESLRSLFKKTMGLGDKAQEFYIKDIHYFFNDIESYVASKGRGDKRDRVEGIDVWKTHKNGKKTTDQIKLVCVIQSTEDGYIINTGMSKKCKSDYYVFVCVDKRIMIFYNIKDKLIFTDDGVFFPNELLYKEKKYGDR